MTELRNGPEHTATFSVPPDFITADSAAEAQVREPVSPDGVQDTTAQVDTIRRRIEGLPDLSPEAARVTQSKVGPALFEQFDEPGPDTAVKPLPEQQRYDPLAEPESPQTLQEHTDLLAAELSGMSPRDRLFHPLTAAKLSGRILGRFFLRGVRGSGVAHEQRQAEQLAQNTPRVRNPFEE
jgi:hypothetical protein